MGRWGRWFGRRADEREEAEPASAFVIEGTDLGWGDSGHILVHGMTTHLERADGSLQLERTGPFLPAVTQPGLGDIIVSDVARRALELAVPGLSFRAVKKARIVRLDWHRWNLDEGVPAEHPDSGEPEDYVLGQPHDPEAAEAMGPVWELVPVIVPEIQLEDAAFNTGAYAGEDFVRSSPDGGLPFVSPRLRAKLAELGSRWISFRPATRRS